MGMTITDALSSAVASILEDASLPGSPVVTGQIETDINAEENVRIVVTGTAAELRKALLHGMYDVSGEVTIFKTIDDQGDGDDLVSEFRALCASVEAIIGQKYYMPMAIQTVDLDIKVYSWNLTSQESFMNSRAMGAKYGWTAFARHLPNNPN
jgi:hypothetical protein